jgi:hypothetical protein
MHRLLLLPLCAALLLVAPPAHALSCVGYPGMTTSGLVDGTAALPDGTPVLEPFDGVLIGTVVRVVGRTAPGRSLDDEVTVELEVLLSRDALPRRVVVSSHDPLWGAWLPFDDGRTYLVPYRLDGERLRSELCEPVREVLADELPGLEALAETQGWVPTADRPDDPAADPAAPAPPRAEDPTTTTATPTAPATATSAPGAVESAASLVGGVALVLSAAAAGHRRRRSRP